MLDFIHLPATGVAEIAESTNLKECPHIFVYSVWCISRVFIYLNVLIVILFGY